MDNNQDRFQKILEDSVEDSQKRGHEYNNKLNEGKVRPPAPEEGYYYFNQDRWQWVKYVPNHNQDPIPNPIPNPNDEKYDEIERLIEEYEKGNYELEELIYHLIFKDFFKDNKDEDDKYTELIERFNKAIYEKNKLFAEQENNIRTALGIEQ